MTGIGDGDNGLPPSIVHPPFQRDRRGLISELVRRLMERRGYSAVHLSLTLGGRLGRAGPAPEVIESWRTGLGGPPPGDVLTELLSMASEDEELSALVDALIGRRRSLKPVPTARLPVLLHGNHTLLFPTEPANCEYVDSVRRTIQQLVNLEMQVGSDQLAPMALRYLRLGRRYLDTGQYEASIERELQAALAELAELAAWLLHDAGQQDAARRLSYEALHLARLAGSPQHLDLFILGNLAHVEIFTSRPSSALQIAVAGLSADSLSRRVAAMFRIREARALAQLGDEAGTKRALESARSNMLDGVANHDPKWSWWLDEPELTHHRGQALASLRMHDRALPFLQQASEDCPSNRISGRFIYLAHSLTEAVEAHAWTEVESIVEQAMPYVREVGSIRAIDVMRDAVARLDGQPIKEVRVTT